MLMTASRTAMLYNRQLEHPWSVAEQPALPAALGKKAALCRFQCAKLE